MLTFTRDLRAQLDAQVAAVFEAYDYDAITHVAISDLGETCYAGPLRGGCSYLIIICKQDSYVRTSHGYLISGEEWEFSFQELGKLIVDGSHHAEEFTLRTSVSLF